MYLRRGCKIQCVPAPIKITGRDYPDTQGSSYYSTTLHVAPSLGICLLLPQLSTTPRRLEAPLSRPLAAVSPGETTLSRRATVNDQNATPEGPTRVQNKRTNNCPQMGLARCAALFLGHLVGYIQIH